MWFIHFIMISTEEGHICRPSFSSKSFWSFLEHIFITLGRAGSLFLEWRLVFGGIKLHGTHGQGHHHLAMVAVRMETLGWTWSSTVVGRRWRDISRVIGEVGKKGRSAGRRVKLAREESRQVCLMFPLSLGIFQKKQYQIKFHQINKKKEFRHQVGTLRVKCGVHNLFSIKIINFDLLANRIELKHPLQINLWKKKYFF